MKHIHEVPQLTEVQDQIGEISDFVYDHRTHLAFGAGLVVGIVLVRALGRPPVVIINNIIEGATSG